MTLKTSDVSAQLAQWIVARSRGASSRLLIIGIQGAIGSGKSTFARNLVGVLNSTRLLPQGQALALSLDDFYLTHAERTRPAFLGKGYNPGDGISNRGPAGTHDLSLLQNSLEALRNSSASSEIELPTFDKAIDDRGPARRVSGKVSILVWDGWFLGAAGPDTAVPTDTPLRRSVATALHAYQPFFDQIDALLTFGPAERRRIVAGRQLQEATLLKQTGHRGMTDAQIERFVDYFYRDSVCSGGTYPEPRPDRISWQATLAPDFSFTHLTSK